MKLDLLDKVHCIKPTFGILWLRIFSCFQRQFGSNNTSLRRISLISQFRTTLSLTGWMKEMHDDIATMKENLPWSSGRSLKSYRWVTIRLCCNIINLQGKYCRWLVTWYQQWTISSINFTSSRRTCSTKVVPKIQLHALLPSITCSMWGKAKKNVTIICAKDWATYITRR